MCVCVCVRVRVRVRACVYIYLCVCVEWKSVCEIVGILIYIYIYIHLIVSLLAPLVASYAHKAALAQQSANLLISEGWIVKVRCQAKGGMAYFCVLAYASVQKNLGMGGFFFLFSFPGPSYYYELHLFNYSFFLS